MIEIHYVVGGTGLCQRALRYTEGYWNGNRLNGLARSLGIKYRKQGRRNQHHSVKRPADRVRSVSRICNDPTPDEIERRKLEIRMKRAS